MSLIQAALEKTDRAQARVAPEKTPSAKPWLRDPMGAHLERQLTQVQNEYARRRAAYRQWILAGVFLSAAAVVLFYFGSSLRKTQTPSRERQAPVVSVHAPVVVPQRTFPGTAFHLTGITNLGEKNVAVVNGEIVGVGDPVSGKAVVKAIDDKSVFLDVRGREIRLDL